MTTLLIFLLFTGTVGFVTWRATRKDDHDSATGYFLAGRSLTWIVVAGSLLLTNLSTEQLVGLNGGGYSNGMQVMAWEVWSSIAIVLMALVFLPRYLRGGVRTVSEFLANRFSRGVGTLVSIMLLLSLLTNLLPFVIYSGGLFMRDVFEVERLFGGNENAALVVTIIALGIAGSIYAIFGGLKAVAVSDTLNGIGLLIGGLLVPILGLQLLGERLGGGGGIMAGFRYLTENKPEMLNPVAMDEKANIPFSTLFTGMLLITTYYWCTNQAIVQRTFGSRSLAEGQKGVLFAALMKLLGPFYLVLPGIIAWHLFSGNLENGDLAYGALVLEVFQSPLMLGFFAAVIFGAILSSFNSGLNSATTLFSVDIYKNLINRDASEERMVKVGKIFGICVAIGAIAVAPLISKASGGLFDLMKNLAMLYNIPLLALVLLAIFSKRTPAFAVYVGVIVGIVFYTWFGFFQQVPDTGLRKFFGYELNWLHIGAINFALIMVIMLTIRYIRPRPEPYEQSHTGDVDITPWKWAKPCGIGVLVLIAAMYLLMSRFG
ncbi:MAG: solute:sodium symporter family transporter [Verrucomicrobiales bacterium]|nr:solute:sodium symporter family transporter [Verrucomicrobiales bacterium]